MEFKKPNRYNKRRSRLAVPQRGGSKSVKLRSKQHAAATDKTTGTRSPQSAAKSIAIHINFGSLSKKAITSRVRRLLFTKKAIILIVIIIGFLVAWSIIHGHNQAKSSNNTTNPNKIVENLEYQTVLPAGKSINTLDGWKRVSPPNTDPVYAYIDAIDGIAISVSQQPLPKSFGSDINGKVAEVAKKFNATTKLDADGTAVYIGTSAKGPQSAILTKNSLLILIKSQEKINDASWIRYANSLN